MKSQSFVLKSIAALAVMTLAVAALPASVGAHLGDSSHLHVPGDATTPTSSVWCVSFTKDPGAWRPEGAIAVDTADVENVSIVFMDCDEVLNGHYTIESYEDGVSRVTVGEPVIGMPDGSDDVTAQEVDGADVITVTAWTKHQKKWLQKGDKIAAKLYKANTVSQVKKMLGSFQKHFTGESKWLRKNGERFEPESCLADDMVKWEKRVKQARKSLNKAVTAMNRGNIAALTSNLRQFDRAWTKVEQIYNVGMCDY